MAFFRTRENQHDPKPRADARRQRRQQLQAQQQLIAAYQSSCLESEPAAWFAATADLPERELHFAVVDR